MSDIQTVGVIGAGTMGAGIAQLLVQHGYHCLLRDVDAAFVQKGVETIRRAFDRLVERDRLSAADRAAALARLTSVTDAAALADADAVIEAVPERIDLKRALFAELDQICTRALFLASNTSSLPVQNMAAATRHPQRVLGLHFFNPAPVLPLVEIVVPLTTDPQVADTAEALIRSLGKTPVRTKDTPGFVANRLFVPFALDAMRLLESGTATAEDIDAACRLGLSHALGPLATADLIGLDVALAVADAMYDETRDPRLAAPTLLRRMVAAGWLGRKSGRGFFLYRPD